MNRPTDDYKDPKEKFRTGTPEGKPLLNTGSKQTDVVEDCLAFLEGLAAENDRAVDSCRGGTLSNIERTKFYNNARELRTWANKINKLRDALIKTRQELDEANRICDAVNTVEVRTSLLIFRNGMFDGLIRTVSDKSRQEYKTAIDRVLAEIKNRGERQ